eukprot:NODE_2798_length_2143_cov_2.449901.p1 GENE.NODE_2798_length_2143_cov_2.449901~~NODE_2798_length_2143_cov_2.449901.p1  ORF type:complete len:642 (+),score=190.99 NODE_2798_length_2143_cov_2.449901:253-1926(+)
MPALCHVETRIDGERYWEKRRVQNLLRRLLESLQERFGLEDDARASELGNVAFGALVLRAKEAGLELGTVSRWFNTVACPAPTNPEAADPGGGSSSTAPPGHLIHTLGEVAFTQALAGLNLWPPEMSPADHREVFVALLMPSSSSVRALSSGQPMPKELTRRMFCEGLARVPFNMPDFPVPKHLFSAAHMVSRGDAACPRIVERVAQAVASVFCMEQTGLERVKDQFLSGIVSMEEIQVALPQLVPHSILEQAVLSIIRTSTRYFTRREWHSMAASVRLSPELQQLPSSLQEEKPGDGNELGPMTRQGNAEAPTELPPEAATMARCQQAAPSPMPTHRFTDTDGPAGTRADGDAGIALDFAASEAVATDSSERQLDAEKLAALRAACAELPALACAPKEDDSAPGLSIDWSLCRHSTCGVESPSSDGTTPDAAMAQGGMPASAGHQADEGAGTSQHDEPVQQQQQQQQVQTSSPMVLSRATSSPSSASLTASPPAALGLHSKVMSADDPVAWISMEMHNECRGPFLARAFVRCCQLYEVSMASQAAIEEACGVGDAD